MKAIRQLLLLLLAAGAILVSVANRDIVQLNLPLGAYVLDVPLYLLLLGIFLLGLICGGIASSLARFGRRRKKQAKNKHKSDGGQNTSGAPLAAVGLPKPRKKAVLSLSKPIYKSPNKNEDSL
jgi:uncharacterized integral membrane protein